MENRYDSLWIIQLALIIGIIYLASQGMDGWGWLTLALILTL